MCIETLNVIAYLFWHQKEDQISTGEYENLLRRFHASLTRRGVEGLFGTYSFRVKGVTWMPANRETYCDWYLLRDHRALGTLNAEAITGV